MALATFGVLLIVSKGNLAYLLSGTFGSYGDFLILISAVNWAIFSVLSRGGLNRHPAALMMFYVMALGWLFSCIWIFGFGPGLGEIPQITIPGWLAILTLGIFGSGLAYIAWYDALQALPAAQLSVFINIEPLVTMVIAAFMLGEAITAASVIGGILTILGVYLVNRK